MLIVGAVAATVITGGLVVALGTDDDPARPPPVSASSTGKAGSGSADPGKAGPSPRQGSKIAQPLPASRPSGISIPSLKVTSTLEKLDLDKNRAMETPRDPDKAGWYRPGPTPGALGPSVIAGHVTWNGERSVFFELAELAPGDRIDVKRADGRTAHFTVDRTAVYPKDRFPTVEVYRNIDHAGLRLITCGGTYSEADRRYADNVIVYATLTGSTGG
ncbi:class F sortase [Streptomyces sp. YIM 130001]|uniref:class F sortase n=1 Tax=Streptomyces sp. YIM 130001 TaxID=2259644 RepID=UPI001F08BEE3|nr:class F sortase [Streptomyces sp. YIM 130001]